MCLRAQKTESKLRVSKSYTIDIEVLKAMYKHKERTDESLSQQIERAISLYLRLDKDKKTWKDINSENKK